MGATISAIACGRPATWRVASFGERPASVAAGGRVDEATRALIDAAAGRRYIT